MDGKEHTANLRVYKFEQLDKDTKLEILKVIKENFKKEYLKENLKSEEHCYRSTCSAKDIINELICNFIKTLE